MLKEQIKFAQRCLNKAGFDAGPEDGLYGNRTLDAIICAHLSKKNLPPTWIHWSKNRKLTAYIQTFAHDQGIDVD